MTLLEIFLQIIIIFYPSATFTVHFWTGNNHDLGLPRKRADYL